VPRIHYLFVLNPMNHVIESTFGCCNKAHTEYVYAYRDIFVNIEPLAGRRYVPIPAQIPLLQTLHNVVKVEVTAFGAVGSFNQDATFLALAFDEFRGADWSVVRNTGNVHYRRHNPIAILPVQGPVDTAYRVAYPHNHHACYGQAFVNIPRLDTLTVHILNSNDEPDRRTLYYWFELRFTIKMPRDELENLPVHVDDPRAIHKLVPSE
jgi:hypothetical protein